MSIYKLPETKRKQKNKKDKLNSPINIFIMFITFILSLLVGYFIFSPMFNHSIDSEVVEQVLEEKVANEYVAQTIHEKSVMSVVKGASPSVVSVVIKKTEGSVYDEYMGEEDIFDYFEIPKMLDMPKPENRDDLVEVGAGTGFIVSEDGIILTNRHVVSDANAVYSIITNDGTEYDVKILAINPVQDIGIIKVINTNDVFKPLKLGNSSNIQLGQTAIVIGNALGEFRNTVSVGVISGLGRSILAQGYMGGSETLEDIIQTDAAISQGNSGGPLLNLRGEVIGISTAVSMSGENIGFAIPVNKAKRDLEQVLKQGEITYPFIGIRYVIITEDVAKAESLPVEYGALVVISESGEASSVVPNSPADKAGIQEGSIILEFNGEKITENNTLVRMIQDYLPGDIVELKVLKNGEESIVELELGNWNDYNL